MHRIRNETGLPRSSALAWVGIATLLGLAVRLAPFIHGSFPLNDGGFFVSVVEAVQRVGLFFPPGLDYNGIHIPFAYPPIAAYLTAAASNATGIRPVDLLSIIGVAASTLSIPLVYAVVRQIVSSGRTAILATLAFALAPNGYEWLITGGGVPRAVGFLLALLTLQQLFRFLRAPTLVGSGALGLLFATVALSSVRCAELLLVTIVVLLFARGRSRDVLVRLWPALVGAAAGIAVWDVIVFRVYGPTPLLAALVAGVDPATSAQEMLSLRLSGTPVLGVIDLFALGGALLLAARGRLLLPAWALVSFLADQRTGHAFATIPYALMAAVGAERLLHFGLVRISRASVHASARRLAATAVMVAVALAAVLGAVASPIAAESPLQQLSPAQRQSIAWANGALPPNSRVLVVTPTRWERDGLSSWLPALSDLQSLTTVQGFEWLGTDRFAAQVARHQELQACASQTIGCVSAWMATNSVLADYVWIPKGANPSAQADCCLAARQSLRESTDYRVVYDGPGATIGQVLGGAADNAPVLVGAGDIADCASKGAAETAEIIRRIPGTVFTAGDNVYPVGAADEWTGCYAPTWGTFRDRTMPAPGNHDFYTDAGAAYYAYFGSGAGTPGEGWYSFDVASWHVVVLNSNCDTVSCAPGSPQLTWLQQDLTTHPAECTLAIWHHPLFTSGHEGPTPAVRAFWDVLYREGVDLVINGHEHDYERFAPQDPSGAAEPARGITEIIVGTGGKDLLPWGPAVAANSLVRQNQTFGVLKLTLHPDGWDWTYLPVLDGVFTDSGGASCH